MMWIEDVESDEKTSGVPSVVIIFQYERRYDQEWIN